MAYPKGSSKGNLDKVNSERIRKANKRAEKILKACKMFRTMKEAAKFLNIEYKCAHSCVTLYLYRSRNANKRSEHGTV